MRCDALRVRLQKEQKPAQLVKWKKHELLVRCSAVLRGVRLLLQFHACKRQRQRGERASTLRVAAV